MITEEQFEKAKQLIVEYVEERKKKNVRCYILISTNASNERFVTTDKMMADFLYNMPGKSYQMFEAILI